MSSGTICLYWRGEVRLFVTIDTEPDCDTSWRRSSPLTFTSVTRGIPEFLRPLWDRYGTAPIYFVSPEVARDPECCSVLKQEAARGAVIGAHLHSEYIEPAMTVADPAGRVSSEFPCYAHDTETERDKIENLTSLIEKNIHCRPVWYRAARYGADLDTVRALAELGYRYDSSITPGIDWSSVGGPDHSGAPVQPYWISRNDMYTAADEKTGIGVIEYPITICGKRFGPLGRILPGTWLLYRWLRPTHMTVYEQKRLIDRMRREYAAPDLVLMFHSMEIMINMTPFVRSRWMQRRFLSNLEAVLKYCRYFT